MPFAWALPQRDAACLLCLLLLLGSQARDAFPAVSPSGRFVVMGWASLSKLLAGRVEDVLCAGVFSRFSAVHGCPAHCGGPAL